MNKNQKAEMITQSTIKHTNKARKSRSIASGASQWKLSKVRLKQNEQYQRNRRTLWKR